MRGIDVSHWQGSIDWKKVKSAGYEFAFAKCTEGVSYSDETYERNKSGAREAGLLFGAYHFARLNDPVKEAEWFLSKVGDLREGEIVVLDFEVENNITDEVLWCLKWLQKVEERLGFKPMLYTNEARVKFFNWNSVVANNNGLWVAKYASTSFYVPDYLQRKPVSDEWPFWAIWQYSSRATVPGITGNVDVNVTSMDLATLKKYGKVENCTHSCPKHCTGT